MNKEELAVWLWDHGWGLDEIAADMELQELTVKNMLKRGGVEIDIKQIDPTGRKAAIFKAEWLRATERFNKIIEKEKAR